jgi:hypothetical protein
MNLKSILPLFVTAGLCVACVTEDATAVDGPFPCEGVACATGGTSNGGTSGAGGGPSGRGATGAATNIGGTGSGRDAGVAGNGGSAGATGTGGNGGATAGGGSSGIGGGSSGGSGNGGNGGTAGSGGAAGAGGSPLPIYTLVVDAPANQSTVRGVVTVSGHAPGFLNVEVWDGAHQNPPLTQVTPASDGAFLTTVDTRVLASGSANWTVFAWDSPPGQPFNHTANVPLSLMIDNSSTADAGPTVPETVGIGDIASPATGPAPSEAGKVGGAPFTLVKNWNFGSNGTIKNTSQLISEFLFHDEFGTIGNGTNYGAVTVAANAQTALSGQPIEDPARPTREWTTDVMKAHVRPLSTSQTTVSVSAHNAGCGSIMAKWKLPSGGAHLGKDLLWETRVRMPVPLAAYWFAIWTAGNKWNGGAEMDVLESFGTPNIYPPPAAFHVNSVGGTDTIDYSSWPNGLNAASVPSNRRDLREWHTWTWLYRTNDTYTVYFDGYIVQTGTLHWTLGGGTGGELIDMNFLFDFGWGHTQIADVNITLPASSFPLTYEIDYSRVYLR